MSAPFFFTSFPHYISFSFKHYIKVKRSSGPPNNFCKIMTGREMKWNGYVQLSWIHFHKQVFFYIYPTFEWLVFWLEKKGRSDNYALIKYLTCNVFSFFFMVLNWLIEVASEGKLKYCSLQKQKLSVIFRIKRKIINYGAVNV